MSKKTHVMIQRIQTIYLIIALVQTVALFIFTNSIWHVSCVVPCLKRVNPDLEAEGACEKVADNVQDKIGQIIDTVLE